MTIMCVEAESGVLEEKQFFVEARNAKIMCPSFLDLDEIEDSRRINLAKDVDLFSQRCSTHVFARSASPWYQRLGAVPPQSGLEHQVANQ